MTAIEGVGPQKPQPDARGWLVFDYLPDALQRAEDATQANDHDRMIATGCVQRTRPATQTERALLDHLGYTLPERLTTRVTWITAGIRHRAWPQLSGGSDA